MSFENKTLRKTMKKQGDNALKVLIDGKEVTRVTAAFDLDGDMVLHLLSAAGELAHTENSNARFEAAKEKRGC